MIKVTPKQSDRKYFLSHRDKINRRRRLKYKTNKNAREARLLSNKNYRDKNKDKINKQIGIYYEMFPEKRRVKTRKYKARKRDNSHEPYQNNYIFQRDGWMCQICGRKINKRRKYPDLLCASIDHIIPLSKGGSDSPVNIQASHLRCNMGKHAKIIGQLRLFG